MADCRDFWMWDGAEEDYEPLSCPGCESDLPRDFPVDRQFTCQRCGKTLEAIPIDDDDEEMEFSGKVCIVPDYAISARAN